MHEASAPLNERANIRWLPLMNLDAQIDAYLAHRRRTGELAASSVAAIRYVLRQWARHVDNRPPDEWTDRDVASWLDERRLRPATRKTRISRLRPFVRWLQHQGQIDHDPTREFRRITIPSGNPRDLTLGEIGALLDACPDRRAELIVTLMLQMGLRCGDVARIRIEDIDARRRTLHVRAKGGRGEPTHWEPIPTEAWERVVEAIREAGVSVGPLIRSYQTGDALRPHTVSKLVGRWIRDAGLKEFAHDGRSAHALRHTCAQDMLNAGASLRDVQFALGHTTIRSTEIYTRREPPGLREALEGRSYRHAG